MLFYPDQGKATNLLSPVVGSRFSLLLHAGLVLLLSTQLLFASQLPTFSFLGSPGWLLTLARPADVLSLGSVGFLRLAALPLVVLFVFCPVGFHLWLADDLSGYLLCYPVLWAFSLSLWLVALLQWCGLRS